MPAISKGALELFRAAAELAPSDFDTLANLPLTELRLGRQQQALGSFERALAVRPNEVRLLNLAAQIHYRQGRLAAAEALLRKIAGNQSEAARDCEGRRDVGA